MTEQVKLKDLYNMIIKDRLKNLKAFTIVELLTVMSIIILLLGLLVPSLQRVKRYAIKVEQVNQFHAIGIALEIFSAEWNQYPPSNANLDGFCGCMKLCEAMVGLTCDGYMPYSFFDVSTDLPRYDSTTDYSDWRAYLRLDQANVYNLRDIYSSGDFSGMFSSILPEKISVLCDSYKRFNTSKITGKAIGMPILYYKAKDSYKEYNLTYADTTIYNCYDNMPLVLIPTPLSKFQHPLLSDWDWFYRKTTNTNSTGSIRPYRSDTFLLQSAGWDGLYGTTDDVFNF